MFDKGYLYSLNVRVDVMGVDNNDHKSNNVVVDAGETISID